MYIPSQCVNHPYHHHLGMYMKIKGTFLEVNKIWYNLRNKKVSPLIRFLIKTILKQTRGKSNLYMFVNVRSNHS